MLNTTQPAQPQAAKPKRTLKRELLSWAKSLAFAFVIAMILQFFVFTIARVEGRSMQNTLYTGERIYVSKLLANLNGYQRGDVVVCRHPEGTRNWVKRVIGLPGEQVEFRDGQVLIDGAVIDEPYAAADHYKDAVWNLGEGEYFVMGDNRPASVDSRTYGAVSEMIGIARVIIWPLDKIGDIS